MAPVIRILKLAAHSSDGDPSQMPDSQLDDDELEEEDDDNDIYASDDEAFEISNPLTTPHAQPSPSMKARPVDRAFRERIRSDLITAKQAGFKVGVLGHVLEGFNAFVTVSIRISKLGISEEAMQAWQVEASEYLMLILQCKYSHM